MSWCRGIVTRQTTVRLPEDLADHAEAVARVQGTSVNALIVESLAGEIERVRADKDFTERALSCSNATRNCSTGSPGDQIHQPGRIPLACRAGHRCRGCRAGHRRPRRRRRRRGMDRCLAPSSCPLSQVADENARVDGGKEVQELRCKERQLHAE